MVQQHPINESLHKSRNEEVSGEGGLNVL